MKKRNLFITLGLALGLGLGVAAGLGARQEVKEAKAENEWLCCVTLDLAASNCQIPTYNGYDSTKNMFRCWKDGDDSSVRELYMHETGVTNVYMVIAKFASDYSFDRIQFRYTESSGNKYSVVEDDFTINSASHHAIRAYNYQGGWTGDNWNLYVATNESPEFDNDDSLVSFTEDAANTRFIATDVEITSGKYGNFYIVQSTNGYCDMVDTASRSLLSGIGTTWMCYGESTTCDIILDNNYSDGGVLRLKKHESVDSYIYYVTNNTSGNPNTDYIYSWGGSSQFGAFPGTRITSVVGVQEVTGNGVLHFQNNGDKLIYKIPVSIGYPNDTGFNFNNGTNEYQTADLTLVAGAAYWWTGGANANAGAGLDFLVAAEAIRNAAADYSVCNVSKANATIVVNAYNALSQDVRTTYVDASTVYTHRRDGQAGEELVSYRLVVEQLSAIAEVDLVNSSRITFSALFEGKDGTTAIVIAIVTLSAISFAALLVIRKRKHN